MAVELNKKQEFFRSFNNERDWQINCKREEKMQGERMKVADRYISAVCSIKGKCDAILLTFFELFSSSIIFS
jgi:hypothetical protein